MEAKVLHKYSMADPVNSTGKTLQKWDGKVQLSCKLCSRHLAASDLVLDVPQDLGLSPTRK